MCPLGTLARDLPPRCTHSTGETFRRFPQDSFLRTVVNVMLCFAGPKMLSLLSLPFTLTPFYMFPPKDTRQYVFSPF